jgi:hypothetical protein
MCIATIIFEDIDQANGKFNVNVNVEGATDGFASAAHITAMFIADAVKTPQFGEGAAAYGQAKGFSLRYDEPQRIVLTLTDVDLDAGSFDVTVEESETAIVEGSVTAAYLSASFVKDAMGTVEFRIACTEFAYSLTEQFEGATVNEPTIQPVVAANTNSEQEAA